MAVKQVFETYVYDPGLSSVGRMPFVLMRVNLRHANACGKTPHDSKRFSRMTQDKRACSRKRCVSQLQCWLKIRLREQARSHRRAGMNLERD